MTVTIFIFKHAVKLINYKMLDFVLTLSEFLKYENKILIAPSASMVLTDCILYTHTHTRCTLIALTDKTIEFWVAYVQEKGLIQTKQTNITKDVNNT